MKIDYRMTNNFVSTAYIDFEFEGRAVGSNKHTDEPVWVYWNGDEWIEEERN